MLSLDFVGLAFRAATAAGGLTGTEPTLSQRSAMKLSVRALQQQYIQPEAALLSFTCPQAGALPGANIELEGERWFLELLDAETCAAACLSIGGCLSFDFSGVDGRCYLGDSVVEAVGGLVSSDGYYYYEKTAISAAACRYGCTQNEALNYDASAEVDDGSCVLQVEGCGDPHALNYNHSVNTNNSRWCAYTVLALAFECPAYVGWVPSASDQISNGPSLSECAALCYSDEDCNGFIYSSDTNLYLCSAVMSSSDDISGDTSATFAFFRRRSHDHGPVCMFGCNNANATNFDEAAQVNDGSCTFTRGCTNADSSLYNPEAVEDDGSCNTSVLLLYSCPESNAAANAPVATYSNVSVQECAALCHRNSSCLSFDLRLEVVAGDNCFLHDVAGHNATLVYDESYLHYVYAGIAAVGCVYGCTAQDALNFNPLAQHDDGSCEMPLQGCTDPHALNFLADANIDNGTCVSSLVALRFSCPASGVLVGHNIDIPGVGGHLPDVNSPDECAHACVEVSGCISFEYNEVLARCYLGNGQRSDGTMAAAESFLYYELTDQYHGCLYGCTDPEASNYDPRSEYDDGSCLLPCSGSSCVGDAIRRYSCPTAGRLPENVLLALEGGSTQISNVDRSEACAEICSSTTRCRSFDYSSQYRRCHLGTALLAFESRNSSSYLYYEAVSSLLDGCRYGCTDPQALNYDNTAAQDDGSCIPLLPGCANSLAVNYNQSANEDDGSCIFLPNTGCTNPDASNFDSSATEDDGSCIIPVHLGCTNHLALNYDGAATVDDGSCTFVAAALDVFSCPQVGALQSASDTESQNLPDAQGTEQCAIRCRGSSTCQSFHVSNVSCYVNIYRAGLQGAVLDVGQYEFAYYERTESETACVYGCTQPTALNYNPFAEHDDRSCEEIRPGCTNPSSPSFNLSSNTDDGSCVILGCTNILAHNYNEDATEDDNSCILIALDSFDCPRNGSLPGFDIVLESDSTFIPCSTVSRCAEFCFAMEICLSIDFSPIEARCYLNSGITSSMQPLDVNVFARGYIYLEKVFRLEDACAFGCANSSAMNFDPNATYPLNELCVPIVLGCTDELATNYVPGANFDDAGCEFDDFGPYTCPVTRRYPLASAIADAATDSANCARECTDTDDCNAFIVVTATAQPNMSCYILSSKNDFVQRSEDPTGSASEYYARRLSTEPACRYGCMDNTFSNYDPLATFDDGSCAAHIIDSLAANNTNSVIAAQHVLGCMDPGATNFNPTADVDDGTCVAVNFGCTNTAAVNWNISANVDDGSCVAASLGCTNVSALNYDAAVSIDDGSCVIAALAIFSCPIIGRLEGDDIQIQDSSIATIGITEEDCAAACIATASCVSFDYNLASLQCFLGSGIVGFDGSISVDSDYVYYYRASPGCRYGCTNASSQNYDASASIDDGSCHNNHDIRAGCMDVTAVNYDPLATFPSFCARSNTSLTFQCPQRGAAQLSSLTSDDIIGVFSHNTVDDCGTACLFSAQCRSFDYSAVSQRCHLFATETQLWSGEPGLAYFHYTRMPSSRSEPGCTTTSQESQSVLAGFHEPLNPATAEAMEQLGHPGLRILAEHTRLPSAHTCAMNCVRHGASFDAIQGGTVVSAGLSSACKAFLYAPLIYYCYLIGKSSSAESSQVGVQFASRTTLIGYEFFRRRVFSPETWAVQRGLVPLPPMVVPFGSLIEFSPSQPDLNFLEPEVNWWQVRLLAMPGCSDRGVLLPSTDSERTQYGFHSPGLYDFAAPGQLCYLGQRLRVNATVGI